MEQGQTFRQGLLGQETDRFYFWVRQELLHAPARMAGWPCVCFGWFTPSSWDGGKRQGQAFYHTPLHYTHTAFSSPFMFAHMKGCLSISPCLHTATHTQSSSCLFYCLMTFSSTPPLLTARALSLLPTPAYSFVLLDVYMAGGLHTSLHSFSVFGIHFSHFFCTFPGFACVLFAFLLSRACRAF